MAETRTAIHLRKWIALSNYVILQGMLMLRVPRPPPPAPAAPPQVNFYYHLLGKEIIIYVNLMTQSI